MCGIFGAVFVDADVRVDADAALRSIAYRGPDASKVHRAPGVVLGHNRLAILDLSAAADQPMASADGAVVLVFNGEIYNHHELRDELAALGHAFRTRSDTEVIVEGYRAWGEGVVRRLDGMFAFALYDARTETLLLARDRAGKKPLFYARDAAGGVRFGSEAKAILASGVRAELEPSALASVLAMGYAPAPRSMYRGIAQLPPATFAVARRGGEWREQRFWRAPFGEPPLRMGEEEACSAVRAAVEAAVVRRMEADVPLGAFLSGGIDSTILVAVMARHATRKVRTFSIGFAGDARFDETRYARIAAQAFQTDHTEFVVEPSSFDLVERLVAMHDGPFGDSSAIPMSIVSMLARRHVTVALGGDGGDELFCGYSRFLAAEVEERIPRAVRTAGGLVERALPDRQGWLAASSRARRLVRRAAREFPERLLGWTSYFAFELGELLRPDVARTSDLTEPSDIARRALAGTENATVLSRVLAHNFETYLPGDLLLKADRASMMHSLEVRSPFLDTALIELAARLPDSMRRRGTTTKWILKRAYRDVLPEEIMNRSKMGFGVPLGTWLRGDLKPFLMDHLAEGAALYDWVEPKVVRRLLAEHLSGKVDHGHRLWLLMTLQIWLRSLPARAVAERVPYEAPASP
jgi:asparagine synthase (glutamine-hydrolysing)